MHGGPRRERCRALVDLIPGENQVVVVDGVDHFFTGKVEELSRAIVNWLQNPATR